MTRTYQPCRVCGREHTNPLSSSICPDCGERLAEQTARERAEHEAARAFRRQEDWNDITSVEDLKAWMEENLPEVAEFLRE